MPKRTSLGGFFESAQIPGRTATDLQMLFKSIAEMGDPRFNAILQNIQQATQVQARGAQMRGARLGQDISSALGSLGGGSTGVGTVARGLGASLATAQAGQARLQGLMTQAQLQGDYLGNLLNLATQTSLQGNLGTLNAFVGLRGAEMQTQKSLFDQVLRFIGAGAQAYASTQGGKG